jgi:hypothetical protein
MSEEELGKTMNIKIYKTLAILSITCVCWDSRSQDSLSGS